MTTTFDECFHILVVIGIIICLSGCCSYHEFQTINLSCYIHILFDALTYSCSGGLYLETSGDMLSLFADPDRPKNDKASILSDTIQMLKELTSQVEKLKSEYAALTDESREVILLKKLFIPYRKCKQDLTNLLSGFKQLTQEKNDLREEKASLKSDIENLNGQYLQRMRAMYPWGGMDHSVVMHPSSYPFPMPVPVPTGPIPMHPSMQPYPFYGNQNPAVVPNPCSTYVPYMTHNPMIEQQSTQHASQVMQQSARPHASSKPDPRNKSSDVESRIEKSDDSNDITTDLELKTPGSTSEQVNFWFV